MSTETPSSPPATVGANAGENASPTRPDKRKRIGWKLWLVFLSVPYVLFFLVLGGIEIYVRATKPHVPTLQVFVEVVLPGIATDNETNVLFEGDPWLGWKFLPNLENRWWNWTTFSTNAQGLRYPEKVRKKARGVTRIVCMGDSVTFGFRVPQTSEADPLNIDPLLKTYAQLMEMRLNEGHENKAYDVIPLAVPGYTSHQGLVWLKRDIAKYDPDIVTILYGFNDTHPRTINDKETVPTSRFMVFQRWLMMRSQAMIYLVRWLEERRRQEAAAKGEAPPESRPMVPRVSREDYVANILEMVRVAERHGAKAVVLSPVFRDPVQDVDQCLRFMDYAAALRDACAKAGVPFLKFDEVDISASPHNDALYNEPIHPNFMGHHIMAHDIMRLMRREKMIE